VRICSGTARAAACPARRCLLRRAVVQILAFVATGSAVVQILAFVVVATGSAVVQILAFVATGSQAGHSQLCGDGRPGTHTSSTLAL